MEVVTCAPVGSSDIVGLAIGPNGGYGAISMVDDPVLNSTVGLKVIGGDPNLCLRLAIEGM